MTKTKSDNRTQAQKFKDLAREAGCEDDEVEFETKLRKLARAKTKDAMPKKKKPD